MSTSMYPNKSNEGLHESSSSSSSSHSIHIVRVAIIGASYAGSTLANVLQQHNASNANHHVDGDDDHDDTVTTYHFEYTVFESKVPPFSYIIGGDFNIPSYPMILDRLQLQHQHQSQCGNGGVGTDTDTDTNTNIDINTRTYERKDVIDTLRKSIEKKIMYGRQVISIKGIEVDQEGGKSTSTSKSTSTRKSHMIYTTSSRYNYQEDKQRLQQYGPFDIIVGANGVKSLCRNMHFNRNGYNENDNGVHVYLIGDARWVNDRFYDLGFRRIDQGADLAMRDGLELGKYLIHNHSDNESESESKVDVKMEDKFHARFVRIRQFKRRMIVFALLIALITKIVHIFISQT